MYRRNRRGERGSPWTVPLVMTTGSERPPGTLMTVLFPS